MITQRVKFVFYLRKKIETNKQTNKNKRKKNKPTKQVIAYYIL